MAPAGTAAFWATDEMDRAVTLSRRQMGHEAALPRAGIDGASHKAAVRFLEQVVHLLDQLLATGKIGGVTFDEVCASEKLHLDV
jgi:hypothetical protein